MRAISGLGIVCHVIKGKSFLLLEHISVSYFVEIFNISLDLSAIYFAHYSGYLAFVVYSRHSVLECYNLFSGFKLCIRSFLFYFNEKNATCFTRLCTIFSTWCMLGYKHFVIQRRLVLTTQFIGLVLFSLVS